MCHFFSFPLGFILLRYVDYAMRRVRLLRHFAIEPYVVFDGGPLPAKRETELERKQLREENLSRGKALFAQAKRSKAREYFVKCIDVTPQMAYQYIKVWVLNLSGGMTTDTSPVP